MEKLEKITLYNADCMSIIQDMPDNTFSLAIIDPPYGINAARMNMGHIKQCPATWKKKDWDIEIPSEEYFNQLRRVSKNQIIFGGNYFTDFLPPSRCWLSWSKGTTEGMSFADIELAWTSFDQVSREIRCRYTGAIKYDKCKIIHPTQKPVSLYRWIIEKYYPGEGEILDTHLGSGSSAIASHIMGIPFTGIEIDIDYYNGAKQRIINYQQQLLMF